MQIANCNVQLQFLKWNWLDSWINCNWEKLNFSKKKKEFLQSLARISVEIWFHSNWAKTPGKKLSIAHPAYFVERKVATLHFTKFLRIAALGRPSERCLWIPWGKLYILHTFHFTKMGLDAQLTTFVSVNFTAFHQFSTEIRARLCN